MLVGFELGSHNFDFSLIKRTGPAVVMTIAGVKLTLKLVFGNSGFHCAQVHIVTGAQVHIVHCAQV